MASPTAYRMNEGKVVNTPYGKGIIIKAKKHAYVVKFDNGTEREIWSWEIKKIEN